MTAVWGDGEGAAARATAGRDALLAGGKAEFERWLAGMIPANQRSTPILPPVNAAWHPAFRWSSVASVPSPHTAFTASPMCSTAWYTASTPSASGQTGSASPQIHSAPSPSEVTVAASVTPKRSAAVRRRVAKASASSMAATTVRTVGAGN